MSYPDPSPGCVVESVRTVFGDNKGDWDVRDMLSDSSSGLLGVHLLVPSIIQMLVCRAGLPVFDNALEVLHLAECLA